MKDEVEEIKICIKKWKSKEKDQEVKTKEIDKMKKDQAALRGNASELESKADLTEEYVKELQDCKN